MIDVIQTCTRCKKIKSSDQFKLCGKCRTLLRGQYYRLRRENEIARGHWMAEMKAQMACHDCGASYPENPEKLVWDHRPGEVKIANISDMVFDGLVDEVMREIKKCDLVCPKCHAQRGLDRGQIKQTKVTLTCAHCQRTFRRWPSHIKSHKQYCSRECFQMARRV